MYICYCIDKDLGERHREEVFSAVRAFLLFVPSYYL